VHLDFENVISVFASTKARRRSFPSGIAGIVELINCTWKLN